MLERLTSWRRARRGVTALSLIGAWTVASGCGGSPQRARGVVTLRLAAADPAAVGDAVAARVQRLRRLGKLPPGATHTVVDGDTVGVTVEALMAVSCDDPAVQTVLPTVRGAATRAGTLALYAPLPERSRAVATELRARLPDGADVTTLSTPGGMRVSGATEEALRQVLSGLTALAAGGAQALVAVHADGGEAGQGVWVVPVAPALGQDAVASANARRGEAGDSIVDIAFSPAGALAFAALSERQLQQHLVIALDGRVLSAPRVMGRITGGRAQISLGHIPFATARELAAAIDAAAIPLPETPRVLSEAFTCETHAP